MPTHIKICGVTTSEIAQYAASNGANYIGLVFHPGSVRHINNLNQAKLIVEQAKKYGSTPVAVFVDQTAEQMQQICTAASIDMVQLHGEKAQFEQLFLDARLRRIMAIGVKEDGSYQLPMNILSSLNPQRDFLLFDYKIPGSGLSFNHEEFRYNGEFNYFIAGGLSIDNVASCIEQLHPYAVDASSSIELQPGIKDKKRLKTFITRVRHV